MPQRGRLSSTNLPEAAAFSSHQPFHQPTAHYIEKVFSPGYAGFPWIVRLWR